MIAVRKAELSDIAAVKPTMTARRLAALQTQVLEGAAVTVTRDGAAVALAGLFPMPDHSEAWLAVSPGLKGSRDAALAMRKLWLLLLALPPAHEVRAYVEPGNWRGMRLAQVIGFHAVGQHEGRVMFALNRPGTGLGSRPE